MIDGARLAMLSGLLFAAGGIALIRSSAASRRGFDLRVMPWVEPGWRHHFHARPRWVVPLRSTLASDDLAAAVIAAIFCAAAVASQTTRWALAALAAVVGASMSVWCRQALRSQTQERLTRQIDEHVPQMADILVLHIGAGVPITDALAAVAQMGSGPAAALLQRVADDVEHGSSAVTALRHSCSLTPSRFWRNLAEALATCIERGTPVAAALRAQARDIRQLQSQTLLARSGKQEVAMLVPVVFLVLPAVVVVALFPGWHAMQALL